LARCLISSLNFLGAGTKTTFPWLQSLHHTRGALHCAGLTLYAVLRELQTLLAVWTGACHTCKRTFHDTT
jgi:hypothetical protein